MHESEFGLLHLDKISQGELLSYSHKSIPGCHANH